MPKNYDQMTIEEQEALLESVAQMMRDPSIRMKDMMDTLGYSKRTIGRRMNDARQKYPDLPSNAEIQKRRWSNYTAEQRKAIGDNMRRSKTREKRSDAAVKSWQTRRGKKFPQ